MPWLQTAVIASIASSAVIFMTYTYIYAKYRENSFLLWSLCWIFGILRFAAILSGTVFGQSQFYFLASEGFHLLSALFFILGALRIAKKPFAAVWSVLAAASFLWVIGGNALALPFEAYVLPAYLLSGTAFLVSGLLFIRVFRGLGNMAYLVGFTLILHGIHKYDYPFLRNLEGFAGWGFLLNSVFTLIEALGVVLLFYEKEHRELREKTNLLNSVLTYSPLSIILAERAGKTIFLNQKFHDVFHYSLEDIPDSEQWFLKAYPDPNYRLKVQQDFSEPILNIDNQDISTPKYFQVWDKLGHPHDIEWHYTAIGDLLLFVLNDLTERNKLENELLNLRKMESLSILAGGIAHDFNNALAAISGNVDLARLHSKDPNSILYLDRCRSGLEQATALAQQLLAFSKSAPAQTEILEPGGIFLENARFVLTGSTIQLRDDVATDLWRVEVNKVQLGQVVHNLVLNAVQAMPRGGKVFLKAYNDDQAKQVVLEVADEGTGIPEDILSKIFDPYFTTKERGSGLGLATCYSIIQKFGGKILCRNNDGLGCTFTVMLPAVTTPVPAPENKSGSQTEEKELSAVLLLIDDDPAILKVLEAYAKSRGCVPLTAPDGEKGLEILRQQQRTGLPVNLVLTDLTIPGKMGGKEVLRRIREEGYQLPVVLMSGYVNEADAASVTEMGFADFLQKPFPLDRLGHAIQRLLPH